MSLTVFEFEGKEVRFVGTPDKPEWVAQDVCDVLELSNSRKALERLKPTSKGVTTIYTLKGNQVVNTVYESGLYKLIFTSRKEVAERFQDWVFEEVLPSIRTTGSYSVSSPELDTFNSILAYALAGCTDYNQKSERIMIALLAGAFDPDIALATYNIRKSPDTSPFLLDLQRHQQEAVKQTRLILKQHQIKFAKVLANHQRNAVRNATKLLATIKK